MRLRTETLRTVPLLVGLLAMPAFAGEDHPPLPGTTPLTREGDIASHLVAGVDRFLLRKLDETRARREERWGKTGPVAAQRERLAWILGLRDERVADTTPEPIQPLGGSAVVGTGPGFEVLRVRWPVLEGVTAEGLLLRPTTEASEPFAPAVIALPDADQTPEDLVGGTGGGAMETTPFAARLAARGCHVFIPTLVDRTILPRNGRAKVSNREFLYRPSFELGRHVLGYELQKILAAVDYLVDTTGTFEGPIGVLGYGEGGRLALYAGALDERVDVVAVSGAFGPREAMWAEPLDRNLFGILNEFGDAELAALVAPRPLLVERSAVPTFEMPAGQGGGPGALTTPEPSAVAEELERAERCLRTTRPGTRWAPRAFEGVQPAVGDDLLEAFARKLDVDAEAEGEVGPIEWQAGPERRTTEIAARHARQFAEVEQHTQRMLEESPYVRAGFMADLDTSTLEAYRESVEPYREYFAERVVGRFDDELLDAAPRSRFWRDDPGFTAYEVELDVFPDVIAYGILLMPKGIPAGERRPVVVCQHGLEGRPEDCIVDDHRAYHDFAAKLARKGYVVFAPQNLYLFGDRFRTLQRKANPLGKTLFSVIVPQHRQIVRWLSSLPQVDPERIGFYGLSYGGKSAMRVPALVEEYALSICSADFNDWIWKNASTRARYSYVWTGEYEIYEFDLGNTFNYSEMAALLAPRPFMVERGHFDGVAPDDRVALEFAKVRHLYAAQLGIPERTEIEWFVGPHMIHGVGTFDFLDRHLGPIRPTGAQEAAPAGEE